MDRLMNILITGGNGYIAKSLHKALSIKHNVMSISRTNFDMTNSESVDNFFRHRLFDVIIHCAVKGGSRLHQDNWNVMDDNLKMYYNILNNANNFNKFIHFGSGAEIYSNDTPYGYSKQIISRSMIEKNNFYNLRIFGVFDENELDTRFIKANIKRYIKREPISIYENKCMDFIYMKDLIKLVEYYIENDNLQKEIDCCYNDTISLRGIAEIINSLNDYRVDIECKDEFLNQYTGKKNQQLPVEFVGLREGIKEVYNILK